MAKSGLNYTRTSTEKIQIKGSLSADCKSISYTDAFGCDRDIGVYELLAPFKNEYIELSVQVKSVEDMDLEDGAENGECLG